MLYNLRGSIEQLNNHYRGNNITEERFYKGEEPNYSVIERGFDIIKINKLNEIKKKLQEIQSVKSLLSPIVFLTGDFGTGKTTFIYRLISELVNKQEDTTALEIIDIENLKRENLKELIESIKSKNLILYCNNIEIDSIYKSIIELRNYLSTIQFSEINIYFLLSIRSNMLEVHRKSRDAKSLYAINIDEKLTKREIEELLERLLRNNIVKYRDTLEKSRLVSKIETQYNSDSFVTLMNLISDGKHIDNLRDAYYELSPKCRKAFVYTALVHRFNLLLPASVLKNLVSEDWDEFRIKVINVEGRGILIQDVQPFSTDTAPDLYFRTKHPLIANELIKQIHQSEEKRYNLYKELIQKIHFGSRMSRFLANLLKAMRSSGEFNDSRINTLFDIAYGNFQEDPYFLMHYAINLQNRGTKKEIELAIEKIKYAENLLDHRHDHFIHRKGVLYFKLTKMYFVEEKSELNNTFKYLDEARDWLLLKQQMAPCSSYSYNDLLELLIWELENINFDDYDQARKRIFIEDYFELALNAVNENLDRIVELRNRYERNFQTGEGTKSYLLLLDEMYEKPNLRPFACILLINYYSKIGDQDKRSEYLEEIVAYTSEDEVCKFLFVYYGRELNFVNSRLKFFRLSKTMDWYETENPLRYNYYNYIAECYNMQMQSAADYLARITDKFQSLNPEYQRYWNEPDSELPRVFEGTITTSKGFKVFYSKELHKNIWFEKEDLHRVKIGEKCNVNIRFFLFGYRASLIREPIETH